MKELYFKGHKIQAVIFDWSGTLVDSESFAPVQAFITLFKRNGIQITEELVRESMGLLKKDHLRVLLNNREIAALWAELHGVPDEKTVQYLHDELEQLMPPIAKKYARPIDGVTDLLEELRVHKIKIGSSSGYNRKTLNEIIPIASSHGLTVDFSIASDEVPAGRPAPWMIFRNMEALQVYPPSSVIRIGDTVQDVWEARNAGVWAFSLLENSNELRLAKKQYRNSSVAEAIHSDEAREQAIFKYQVAGTHIILQRVTEFFKWVQG